MPEVRMPAYRSGYGNLQSMETGGAEACFGLEKEMEARQSEKHPFFPRTSTYKFT
jgi:hypothetical protein